MSAASAGVLVLAVLVALGLGDYPMSPAQVVRAIVDPEAGFTRTIVLEWRLPRVLAAVVFGAALGLSGAMFQTLTDNPLGSPDVVGFSTGAYTGALVAMIVLGAGLAGATLGSLVGGIATALLVYAFAFRRGVEGYRLIITGIGVTAALGSVNVWILLVAGREEAMQAAMWGAGSLADVGVHDVAGSSACLVVLGAGVGLLARGLRQLEMGDDTARAHGVRIETVRMAVILVAVALVSVVTAVAGPIAFIALSAPQIAARLARSAGLPLVLSACVGAVLLVAADLVAAHVLPGGVTAGQVTVVVGGAYLLWLLVNSGTGRNRKA
ncbi:FecCD family ABC transporter permease [Brevibacterium litoralis]|uniref:FecCD family ABC transporter permease n=1 Tax=Brevibacterium litoralis TaxID=3138935 RepID=UPI0032EB72E2